MCLGFNDLARQRSHLLFLPKKLDSEQSNETGFADLRHTPPDNQIDLLFLELTFCLAPLLAGVAHMNGFTLEECESHLVLGQGISVDSLLAIETLKQVPDVYTLAKVAQLGTRYLIAIYRVTERLLSWAHSEEVAVGILFGQAPVPSTIDCLD